MRSERVENDLGATAGLRYGNGRSRTPVAKRYLAAENRTLRGQIKGRLLLSEAEKATLAEIAHLSLPKMLSGANAFEISNIQETETEGPLTGRSGCINVAVC